MSDQQRLPAPKTTATDGGAAPSPASEGPRFIGPYRLLHRLGEGGMGEVWLADQDEPVRRKVAVKVIKAGMDTRQVVARFESERQALALMSHSAIAQVFDGGSTPEGRPFFVMEYVAGVSLAEPHAADRAGSGRRHTRVHEPRAGFHGAGCRHPGRRLFAWRHIL